MQKIRTRHSQIARLAKEGKGSTLTNGDIQQEIKNISEELEKDPRNQEVTQYLQHYFQAMDNLNNLKNKNINKQEFDNKFAQIFKVSMKTSQPITKQRQDMINDQPSSGLQKYGKNQNVMSYFESKVAPKAASGSFKSALNDPLLPNNQNFKRKRANFNPVQQQPVKDHRSQQQLQNLRYQNKQLKKLLERTKPNEQETFRYKQKIKQLENEIYELQKNEKAKYTQKYIQQPPYSTQQQQPYVLYPRPNDLKILTQKSESRFDKNEKFDDFSNRDGFILEPSSSRRIFRNNGTKSEYQEKHSEIILAQNNLSRKFQDERSFQRLYSMNNIQRGSQFDSFSLHSSNYSVSHIPGRQRYGVQDPLTCTRNKVAFFKNSLRIVYDDKYEIAFKRSQLNAQLNQLRLIFFVKNKTFRSQQVIIQYQKQRNFNISIQQKMRGVEANGQSRQVLIIQNKNDYEIDSIIDVKFTIGQRVYNLWVPANFIKFDYSFRRLGGSTKSINVIPEKYFETYDQAVKVLPLANKQQAPFQTVAYLYGISRCYEGSIKLTWNRQRQLKIETSQKWISYISFLLCKNM